MAQEVALCDDVDVTIDGFDCSLLHLLMTGLHVACLIMYEKESLHKIVGRPLDIDEGVYGEYSMGLHAVPPYR